MGRKVKEFNTVDKLFIDTNLGKLTTKEIMKRLKCSEKALDAYLKSKTFQGQVTDVKIEPTVVVPPENFVTDHPNKEEGRPYIDGAGFVHKEGTTIMTPRASEMGDRRVGNDYASKSS